MTDDAIRTIYALIDPRTGEPRYVGQTRLSLKQRFKAHMNKRNSEDTHKSRWFRSVIAAGFKPSIVSIYTCYDDATLDAAELFFIEDYKARGFKLTNHMEGGIIGVRHHDLRTKRLIGKRARDAYVNNPELRTKMGEHGKRRWAEMSDSDKEKFANARGRDVKAFWVNISQDRREELSRRRSKVAKDIWASMSADRRAEVVRNGAKARTGVKASPEAVANRTRGIKAAMTPELRKTLSQKRKDYWNSLTAEEKAAIASKRLRTIADMPEEQRKQIGYSISKGRQRAKALRNKKGLG